MRNMKSEFESPKVDTMNIRTNIYKMLFLAVISVIVSSLLMTDLNMERFIGGALISFGMRHIGCAHAGRRITTQCNETLHTKRLIFLHNIVDLLL